jgi:hypothetical protein
MKQPAASQQVWTSFLTTLVKLNYFSNPRVFEYAIQNLSFDDIETIFPLIHALNTNVLMVMASKPLFQCVEKVCETLLEKYAGTSQQLSEEEKNQLSALFDLYLERKKMEEKGWFSTS